jgi:hypothetical protein
VQIQKLHSLTPSMMHSNDNNWNINVIKDGYAYLELTNEQAEQVFLFEQNNRHQGKTFFTDWEQWDYQLHFFSQILDKNQFAKFSQKQKKQIRWHEKGLKKQLEEESLKRIDYTTQIITYYEQQLLPDLFSSGIQLGFGSVYSENSKVDFLKAEYKKFLQESRTELLINHFKYYRTHSPITLKATLLNHKISYLWPDYRFFKIRMDEPTKSTAAFLEKELYFLPKELDPFLQKISKEASAFFRELSAKYYSDYPVYTYGQSSPKEEMEGRLMSLILIDENQYGWNPSLLT